MGKWKRAETDTFCRQLERPKTTELNRRQFIINSSFATAGVLIGTGTSTSAFAGPNYTQIQHPFPILQGPTSDTTTQLTIDVPGGMTVSFRIVNTRTAEVHLPRKRFQRSEYRSPFEVHGVYFEGLNHQDRYLFQVLDKDNIVLDERKLRTIDINKPSLQVGLISCADQAVANYEIWERVLGTGCDFLIFMGDNIYGDYGRSSDPSPQDLWERYIVGRTNTHYYHLAELIPVLSTWDDHDYGKDNEDGNYTHKEHSKRIFETFYPRHSIPGVFEAGPGVSSVFRAGKLQFVLLDDRYFRSQHDDHYGSTLGAEQTEWVFRKVSDFDGVTWLVHGTQIFGGSNRGDGTFGESFDGHYKYGFRDFMDGLRNCNRPLLFASGDVHFSEVAEIEEDFLGYKTYEFTSSGIHSGQLPFVPSNRRRRKGTNRRNFFTVRHDFSPESLTLTMHSMATNKLFLFRDQMHLGL